MKNFFRQREVCKKLQLDCDGPNDRLIDAKTVRELAGGISASTLWRRIQQGKIPSPVALVIDDLVDSRRMD